MRVTTKPGGGEVPSLVPAAGAVGATLALSASVLFGPRWYARIYGIQLLPLLFGLLVSLRVAAGRSRGILLDYGRLFGVGLAFLCPFALYLGSKKVVVAGSVLVLAAGAVGGAMATRRTLEEGWKASERQRMSLLVCVGTSVAFTVLVATRYWPPNRFTVLVAIPAGLAALVSLALAAERLRGSYWFGLLQGLGLGMAAYSSERMYLGIRISPSIMYVDWVAGLAVGVVIMIIGFVGIGGKTKRTSDVP